MELEKVLKVMAAVTAMLVACSEVLNQANQYYKSRKESTTKDEPASTMEATSSPAAE